MLAHNMILSGRVKTEKSQNSMKKVSIKPLSTRVVVEPMDAETVTSSGIIIPESAQEKQAKGTIIAVGKGSEENIMEVKVGDKVLYGKFAGTEVELDGTNYLIMEQSDILAVI